MRFLTERVEYYRRLRNIEEVARSLENHKPVEPGTAARLIREDRDNC